MISRRRFLFTSLSVIALGCRKEDPPETMDLSSTPSSTKQIPQKTTESIPPEPTPSEAVDTSPVLVKADIPARVLFPSRKPRAGSPFVRATSLRLQSPSVLVISFSRGSELRLDPTASFNSLRRRKKATRNAVAVKSIVSWLLDSLDRRTRDKMDVEIYTRLRQQFQRLQEQPVLEAASLGAVLELAKEVQASRGIKSVRFARGLFIIE